MRTSSRPAGWTSVRRLAAAAFAAWVLALLLPAAGRAADATLAIDPVPTKADPDPGTPVVRWSTGNGAPGEVVVVTSDGAQRLFAAEGRGTGEAPWIQPGVVYTFRLVQKAPKRQVVAEVVLGEDDAKASDIRPAAALPAATSEVENIAMVVVAFGGLLAIAALALALVSPVRRDA